MNSANDDGWLRIAGGKVYDPANGVSGVVKDLWIRGGKIVHEPSERELAAGSVRTLDAKGLVIMPGGVDMHCHIAGPKVNTARKMRPEEKRDESYLKKTDLLRSGTIGSVPSTFATSYLYLGLGYTTAFDAAVPALGARHAYEEFEDTPCLDKGFFVLMGNHHFVMDSIRRGEPDRLRDFVAWLLKSAGGYAPKLVNPGGVENWKRRPDGNACEIDQQIDGFGVTPRQIVTGVAQAAAEIGLPHPVHIHCNQLGLPGNWRITRDTMLALEGRRGHLTHIQFHSYGGGAGDEETFRSRASDLAAIVNANENITVDVGQVMFGKSTSMTGDGPLGHYLHQVYGTKWFSGDLECEAGCGIAPIEYRNKSLVHALQWAIGLEWYLLVDDAWRIGMSTDHPNGASFLAYPEICHLLMSRDRRREAIERCPPGLLERSVLADLDREYTLEEICIVTRAAPARMLGLKSKGHLGPGADADVTIYTPSADPTEMLSAPRYVLKAGEILVEDSDIRRIVPGSVLRVAPSYDDALLASLVPWFEQNYTLRFGNYPLGEETLHGSRVVACG
ncbi:MAG TPA: formylmethanofuran dehydrogenase subunit A [Pirellulaceae bacterium]|jgi:formylmethanofuran dehydrogenase subunit A|nr:formylmethanofuran dehydrogenase subunit A [Pirellulaceae bacterium]